MCVKVIQYLRTFLLFLILFRDILRLREYLGLTIYFPLFFLLVLGILPSALQWAIILKPLGREQLFFLDSLIGIFKQANLLFL